MRNVYAVKLLLKYGYDTDKVHLDGRCIEAKGTPLSYAVWLGFTEAVTILLEAGADVTKMGIVGQTAPEMAKKCLSFPTAKGNSAKSMSLEDSKGDAGSRHRILRMVCADLKTNHGMEYEDLINSIQK